MAKCRNRDNHTTKKGIFNAPWFAFLIICCIKSTSLNPDANSSRVPQGIAAAAVTNAGGVAIDAHDADHRADVRASLAGNDAEAIVLDLVQPMAARGQLIGFGWEARRDEPGREGTLRHVKRVIVG